MSVSLAKVQELIESLSSDQREALERVARIKLSGALWYPLPGPQTEAYRSGADLVGYGGAAGGGKTDLALGKALTQHTRTAIFRRYGTEQTANIDRMAELLGGRDGFNGKDRIWRLPGGKQVEFCSVPNAGDEVHYQGRPKDLLVFDEAANFLESQVRFLMGWARTTDPDQRVTTLMCFNPPTTAEGAWIVQFFAPWLVPEYPNPALPGEIRWFAMINGEEREVKSREPFYHKDELIVPQSRTFIPSKVLDNPYLMGTGYMATLQALPEPLRSQMLFGDFQAGMEDDPWQVIPTAWVAAAQDRWRPRDPKGPMDSMGVDVARGGPDKTVIARRHGMWFDELIRLKGTETDDGPKVAGAVVKYRRDRAPVHVDILGPGGSVFDTLRQNEVHTVAVDNSKKSYGVDQTHQLKFLNLRAETYWRMREALDPANDTGIALPPDPKLRADLCTPKWEYRAGGVIKVQDKREIIKLLGRSPDDGDAVVLGLIHTAKQQPNDSSGPTVLDEGYDPYN